MGLAAPPHPPAPPPLPSPSPGGLPRQSPAPDSSGGTGTPPGSHRGGRIREARGSPRVRGGGGGGPFICLSPRHYHADPHPPGPPRRRAARLLRSWGERRGKGERVRGAGMGGVGGERNLPCKVCVWRGGPAGRYSRCGCRRSWRRAGSRGVPGVLAPVRARGSHVAEREAPGVRGKEQCCLSVPALISE